MASSKNTTDFKMKSKPAEKKHEEFYQDLCAAIDKHADVSPPEMLAIVSKLVGRLVALQDQRTMTSAMVMKIVTDNLKLGNQDMLDQVMDSKGNA